MGRFFTFKTAFALLGEVKATTKDIFQIPILFVVDLQSCKKSGGSTTVSFSLSSLQPAAIRPIDRIFKIDYTGFDLF
jgi:hypothetical protein